MPRGAADHPLLPAFIGLGLALAVVATALARGQSDLSALVRAGAPFADPASVPEGLSVEAKGYDGMFYYRLALDPLTDRMTAHGITFDAPAYRQQRILYPLLAWLVAAGDTQRVPLALVLVNVGAMFAIGWIGGAIARDAGRHAMWGSLFPLYPGTFVTLTNDLTEIVAAALLLAGLWLLRRERATAAAVPLALSVLGRETTAIATAAVGLARVVTDPRSWRRWMPLVVPSLVLIGWQISLAARWQRPVPAKQGVGELWPPFVGIVGAAWANGERLGGIDAAFWALSTLFVLAMIAIGAWTVASARTDERTAWYAYLALASSSSRTSGRTSRRCGSSRSWRCSRD